MRQKNGRKYNSQKLEGRPNTYIEAKINKTYF